MKALDVLRSDHDLVFELLDRLEQTLDPLDLDRLGRILEVLADFVDGVHQQKEEEVLFPVVIGQLRDMARGAVESLTKEHFMARAYLRAGRRAFDAARAGDDAARAMVENSLRNYAVLIRNHVQKENDVLFPFIERALDPEVDAELVAEMAAVQDQVTNGTGLAAVEAILGMTDPPTEPHRATFIDARTLSTEDLPSTPTDETYLEARVGGSLFDDGNHQNVWLHDFGRGMAVQANQFLIVDNGEGMVLDPGGPKVYADVYAETMLRLHGGNLRYVFLSHQDPDIGTSLNAWLMDTKATAYVSKLWVRFLPHFGIDRLLEKRLIGIPDEGMTLPLGRSELVLVPAHFLHSAGNFQVYDPRSRVLFSGDLGASLGTQQSVVRDFEEHKKLMRGFHRRYIPTGAALRAWARLVRQLDIETIAPQHGAVIRGKEMVHQFIDWCEDLRCGMDLVEDPYRLPGERTMITRTKG